MAHLAPRERMLKDFFEDMGSLATGPIGPAVTYWYNLNLVPYPYNPDKARKILLEAGYEWDEEAKAWLFPLP